MLYKKLIKQALLSGGLLPRRITSELQKNEPKSLKGLSRAQNRTLSRLVLCPGRRARRSDPD